MHSGSTCASPELAPNKKWAISPLISPPAGAHTGNCLADKRVCAYRIRRIAGKYNRQRPRGRTWLERPSRNIEGMRLPRRRRRIRQIVLGIVSVVIPDPNALGAAARHRPADLLEVDEHSRFQAWLHTAAVSAASKLADCLLIGGRKGCQGGYEILRAPAQILAVEISELF